jgi:hypothetical protein
MERFWLAPRCGGVEVKLRGQALPLSAAILRSTAVTNIYQQARPDLTPLSYRDTLH